MQTIIESQKHRFGMYRLALRQRHTQVIDGQYFHNELNIANRVLGRMQGMIEKAGMKHRYVDGGYVLEQNPIYNIKGNIKEFKKEKFSFTHILLN